MVTHESDLLAILVSPHSPMISGSCTMHDTIRDTESGKILVSASTMRTTSNRSGLTPVERHSELKNSYSNVVIRSSNMTFWRKLMSRTCESRLPRLPGFGSRCSVGLPTLATRIIGTRCCFDLSTVLSS